MVHPLAGFAVTVYAAPALQVKGICCVTVPRSGPGDREGSIELNAIPPANEPTKEQTPEVIFILVARVSLPTGLLLSLKVIVNEKVPTWVGVPEITAVSEGDGEGTSVSPGGRLPAVSAHVYGVVPLFPVRVAVYGWCCRPFGGFPAILSGGALSAKSVAPTIRMDKNSIKASF
jgi:hypothetical protein